MSIENEIKNLTAAVAELTAAITNSEIKPKNEVITAIEDLASEPEKVKEAKPVKEAEPTESSVTAQDVKELAKKKMAEGVERSAIKALIVELGAGSIADLDASGLVVFNDRLGVM